MCSPCHKETFLLSQKSIMIVSLAEQFARNHHSKYDPSHDFSHVNRVRKLALRIASAYPDIDLLVVELSALFHDLFDGKYAGQNAGKCSDLEYLDTFWGSVDEGEITPAQRASVAKIIDNVSYSKEKKRLETGVNDPWFLTCKELHCVQDSDKLDAIGAVGILRCAAFSGAKNIPLILNNEGELSKETAVGHFEDKLVKLEALMKTDLGKKLAIERTRFIRSFLSQLENEGSLEQGR